LERLYRTLTFGEWYPRNTQIPTHDEIVNFQEAKDLQSSLIEFKIQPSFESIKKNKSPEFLWIEFML
jgi:hypothetical protein